MVSVLKKFAAIIALLALSPWVWAGDSIETVFQKAIDASECEWQPARTFKTKQTTGFDASLAKLAKYHWALAWRTERELDEFDFCLTKTKLPIITEGELARSIYYTKFSTKTDANPVAIRIGNKVWASKSKLAAIGSWEKAQMLIILCMDRVIDPKKDGRTAKAGKLLKLVNESAFKKFRPQELESIFKANDVLMPHKLETLAPFKDDILNAFTPGVEPEVALKATLDIIKKIPKSWNGVGLHPTFQALLTEANYQELQSRKIQLDKYLLESFQNDDYDRMVFWLQNGADPSIQSGNLTIAQMAVKAHDFKALEVLKKYAPEGLNKMGWFHEQTPMDQTGCQYLQSPLARALSAKDKKISLLLLESPKLNVGIGTVHTLQCMQIESPLGRQDAEWHSIFSAIDFGDLEVITAIIRHPSFKAPLKITIPVGKQFQGATGPEYQRQNPLQYAEAKRLKAVAAHLKTFKLWQ